MDNLIISKLSNLIQIISELFTLVNNGRFYLIDRHLGRPVRSPTSDY